MPEEYSNEELIAAYLLRKSFSGEKLQEKMKECRIQEEVAILSIEELKKLLEKRFSSS